MLTFPGKIIPGEGEGRGTHVSSSGRLLLPPIFFSIFGALLMIWFGLIEPLNCSEWEMTEEVMCRGYGVEERKTTTLAQLFRTERGNYL